MNWRERHRPECRPLWHREDRLLREIPLDQVGVRAQHPGRDERLATARIRGRDRCEIEGGNEMGTQFPAIGHTYRVDFGAFVVELYFESDTKLTYTGIRKDGSRGASETVAISVTFLRENLFMVTWQEADKTTVVHVEDYENNIIYTNITDADNKFEKFKGSVTLLK
jgi:hypothetical protein